jgi:hypothetical protein
VVALELVDQVPEAVARAQVLAAPEAVGPGLAPAVAARVPGVAVPLPAVAVRPLGGAVRLLGVAVLVRLVVDRLVALVVRRLGGVDSRAGGRVDRRTGMGIRPRTGAGSLGPGEMTRLSGIRSVARCRVRGGVMTVPVAIGVMIVGPGALVRGVE